MQLGTIVKLSDGRIGTVVYNGFDGIGIKWRRHDPDLRDFEGTSGGLRDDTVTDDWPWYPDAILRDPWDGCERAGWLREQCVGEKYQIIR
jgi:hypothetical protein